MANEPEIGSEVFTENGRRASYAGEIDGQKFVRIILSREDEEYGCEEWLSDNLTPVSRVFDTPPVESYSPIIEQIKASIERLREEERGIRASVMDLQKQERECRAATKYPDIATAIDFIEGRITHVAIVPTYATGKVIPLSEFLASTDYRRTDGLKLICLFGCDQKGDRKWRVNDYRDGSGSWTEIVPFKSEGEAWAYLRADFDAELELWRGGESKHKAHNRSTAFPESEWPEDWRMHVDGLKAARATEKLEKLRAEIAAIEAEQVPA